MKTFKYMAIAAAVLAASSCLNESEQLPQTDGKVFTAAFAEGETKAVLKPGVETSAVEWETTDHVSILAGESNWDYAAQTAGTATTLKYVSESAQGDKFYALYPYDATATLADGVITTTLPAEQTAVPGSFSAHMAVAYTETNALAFKNGCGLVRVKVISEGVTKVVFEGKSDEYVAGKIAVTVADEPTWIATTESSKTVALVAEEGKTLAKGDYYLATLPQRFQAGFTVKVYCGETLAQTKDVAADLTLQRCQVVPGSVGFDVESIAPTIATVGETITVTGYGFTADTKVKINGTEATVSVTSSTSLAVTVPSGLSKATDYKLSVEVPGFDAVETEPFRYFYLPEYTSKTISVKYTLNDTEKTLVPEGLALTSDGYMWITDRNSSPHVLLKVKLSADSYEVAQVVSAGSYPFGCDVDSNNDIYVAAKTGNGVGAVVNGSWSITQYTKYLNNPMDLVFGDNDNMYVASRDNGNIVCLTTDTPKVYTVYRPTALALDHSQTKIFFGTGAKAETDTGAWYLHMLDLETGEVTPVAGSNIKPKSGTYTNGAVGNTLSAVVGNIGGVYCCSDGYVYYTDQGSHALQVVIPGVRGDYTKGIVKTLIGVLGSAGSDEIGSSAAPTGKLKTPSDVEIDANGVIYIAGNSNKVIRVLTPKVN